MHTSEEGEVGRRGRETRLKLDVQGQGGGRILDAAGQEEWRVFKIGQFSWTSYVYHPLCLHIWKQVLKTLKAELSFQVFKRSISDWFGPKCKCKGSSYLNNYSYNTTTL